ncbi:MAG: hypothetical protein JW765_01800 [Deltaproteobacteria bacterium]|nr:hypothetical protein [Candidatus Zymogenaceae bacterium]
MKNILAKRSFVLFTIVITAAFCFFAGSAFAEPDISGQWQSNLGVIYNITQIGDKFTWHMPSNNQMGFGDINGTNVSAVWPIGYATGTITVDTANRGIGINWSNGVVFTRPASPPPAPTPPAYTWQQIGTPAAAIYAGGNRLFATNPSSGDIYEYSGTPGSWTKVGSPGNMFAVGGNGQLYGLSPDLSGVWRYDNTPMNWTQIGGPASRIYARGNQLFATNPSTGDIYQYNHTPDSWTKIGGPGNVFAVGGMGQLYGLSPDMSGVWRYDGTPMSWTKIGGPASKIYAGGNQLFATNPSTGDIYRYDGTPNAWTKVGGPGYSFTVGGNGQLYGISPDMSGVWKYSGTPMIWTIIGEQAYAIAAAGNNLYGIQSGTLTVWRYIP